MFQLRKYSSHEKRARYVEQQNLLIHSSSFWPQRMNSKKGKTLQLSELQHQCRIKLESVCLRHQLFTWTVMLTSKNELPVASEPTWAIIQYPMSNQQMGGYFPSPSVKKATSPNFLTNTHDDELAYNQNRITQAVRTHHSLLKNHIAGRCHICPGCRSGKAVRCLPQKTQCRYRPIDQNATDASSVKI